jgi:hypothetical protein
MNNNNKGTIFKVDKKVPSCFFRFSPLKDYSFFIVEIKVQPGAEPQWGIRGQLPP